MNTLVIDTSTETALIGITSTSGHADATMATGNTHATTIIQNIDACLAELHMNIHDIELIGVGIGPGSFTGIRIAVTTARMLAQMIQCPLIGIKSQTFYAISTNAKINENILVAFDAKKQRVFGALYKQNPENLLKTIVEPGDYPISTLLSNIPDNNKTICIGDGVTAYRDTITISCKDYAIQTLIMPDSKKACRLVNAIINNNPEKQMSYNDITPFYARKSDAEIMKELKYQIDN